MPRAPWRRRRSTDSPRPAGRRWAGRLRRSGSLARQVLLVGRPGRRRAESGANTTTLILPEHHDPDSLKSGARLRRRAMVVPPGGSGLAADAVPAVHPAAPVVVPDTPFISAEPVTEPVQAAPDPATPPTLLPGPQTRARKLRFVAVNGCTVGSILLGITAIFLARGHVGLHWAALCLIACVVFDGLDGALARRFDVSSPFGAQMDSLADMCSFGIAAPVVVYSWLAPSAPAWLAAPACGLVAVCAAIRLARFNVSPKDGRFFSGVPTTMVAAVLALGTLISPDMPAPAKIAAVALLALAMVSSFPYAKLARLLRLPPWLLVLPAVGALIDYRLTFAGVVVTYLASGPLVWLRQR